MHYCFESAFLGFCDTELGGRSRAVSAPQVGVSQPAGGMQGLPVSGTCRGRDKGRHKARLLKVIFVYQSNIHYIHTHTHMWQQLKMYQKMLT